MSKSVSGPLNSPSNVAFFFGTVVSDPAEDYKRNEEFDSSVLVLKLKSEFTDSTKKGTERDVWYRARFVAFNGLADALNNSVKKGDTIAAIGCVRNRFYEDEESRKRTYYPEYRMVSFAKAGSCPDPAQMIAAALSAGKAEG